MQKQMLYQDSAVSLLYDKVVRNISYSDGTNIYDAADIYTVKHTVYETGKFEAGTDETVWEEREKKGWTTMYETYTAYARPVKVTYILTWVVQNEKIQSWVIYRQGWADKIACMERYDPKGEDDYECYDYTDEIEGIEGWLGNARMWSTLTGQALPKYYGYCKFCVKRVK